MLRPISFSIPSSTELRIVFNKDLSEGLSKDNFSVESISGNVGNLTVRRAEVFGNYVIVTTSPQIAGNFYNLHLKDTDGSRFISKDGLPLVNDDVSRRLFFVGLKNHNPVRDRMYYNVPKTYELENSNISNILSSQAEELFKAQKDLGEVLSDNYISVSVQDERRTRSSGATDRLANEGTYEVSRVSDKPANDLLVFRQINYSEDSDIIRHSEVYKHPISLQETLAQEEISLTSTDNSFEGFLLKASKDNIIKVMSIRHIKPDDTENCYGEIGTEYSIPTCKYSVLDNSYDKDCALKNINLKSNEILLSEFGNIDQPVLGDKIEVSYIYRDRSIQVNEDSLEIFKLLSSSGESVPSNTSRFFLENAPIVTSENEVPELEGVAFYSNSGERPKAFLRELAFNSSKLPSVPGEYCVNYSTGEVIVAGVNSFGEGTGSSPVSADYLYRNMFSKNLDYYVEGSDIVPVEGRDLIGGEATIEFNYEKVYVDGVDYIAPCHAEIYNEHIENNLESSFVIRPQKTPVTGVNRIFNQTTGEIYNPLYHTSEEIHFTGKRSPEIKTEANELARFKIAEESVAPSGEFICPAFTVTILSNASNSNIRFSPGIPAELIEQNSLSYFARSMGVLEDAEVSDIQIRFFGQPDSNGLIKSFAISSTATPPSLRETVSVGTRALRFDLESSLILSKTEDSLGSYINTSVEFGDKEIFKREKYFKPAGDPSSLLSGRDNIQKIISEDNSDAFFENLSRLRRSGDYSIDYYNGIVYVAIDKDADLAPISLRCLSGKVDCYNKNIISLTGAFKKLSSAEDNSNSNVIYDSLENDSEFGQILDLESSIMFHTDSLVAIDSSSNIKDAYTVLEDYTILAPHVIGGVRGVYDIGLLAGEHLDREAPEERVEDLGSDVAQLNIALGGANLYNKKTMSYDNNVIDLKIHSRPKARSIGDKLLVKVRDENFGEILEVKHDKTGRVVFDEKLNIEKISDLDVVDSKAIEGGQVYADIRSGVNLAPIDAEDFLLDSAGNRFQVISADPVLSRVFVQSPSENNVEADAPAVGSASIIVKARVLQVEGGVDIEIPKDTFIDSGDIISIKYVESFIPRPGSRVAADCMHGKIFVSYIYSYDDVYISYEYGDNEIDWSISNSIREGDQYYVSYKYGASRRALRDNFGVLTKIPYFQRFPLEQDREIYRNGLKGVMSAFSNGAMKPSFETLVESFTGIVPNIEESFFGNWILGRDNLSPEDITSKGRLEFRSGKFDEGIYVSDDTVVTTPALSNINLDEGTVSAWVAPDWAGIDNDATITVDLKNIGTSRYVYNLGDNIFDYESGFKTLSSEISIGAADLSGKAITLHNYTHVWADSNHLNEDVSIGVFAIQKPQKNADRTIASQWNISMKVSEFSAPIDLNPPRRRPSEDLAGRRATTGLSGLGKSISDASRGISGSGLEIEKIRLCSPAFISVGDKHKLFMTMFNVEPIINHHSGRVYTFRVGDEHIEKNKIPKYDRRHVTRTCVCSVDNIVPELSKFRDKEFQTIKVELDFEVDLSHIGNFNAIFDEKASIFRAIDTKGSVYEVYALIDEHGDLHYDEIPDKISGFHINRIPENKKYITAHGSEVINDTMPLGEITLAYQTISILTNGGAESSEYLGYERRSYTLDWMSDFIDINLVRDPLNNVASVGIRGADAQERRINLFYTDLIYAEQEEVIFDHLNLDEWFNTASGRYDVDGTKTLSDGLTVGILDQTTMAEIDIRAMSGEVYNRYSLEDIYIGSSAKNPSKLPFSVSRVDTSSMSTGIPYNSETAEGVFIGFDGTCESQLSDNLGQWILRARAAESVEVPVGVLGRSGNDFLFAYEKVPIYNAFEGTILTDGEFSSVVRAKHIEDEVGCPTGLACSASYRYCGETLLESDGEGWTKLEESDSSLVNLLIGGREAQRAGWVRHGAFSSLASGGIYRMGESVSSVDKEGHNVDDGNFVYTRLPCYHGNYEVSVGFKVASFDYSASVTDGLGQFGGVISGMLTGISPIHIYDEDINIKLSLGLSESQLPLLLVMSGNTNDIIDISYFNWNELSDCILTVNKNIDDGIITISSNGSIISKISSDEVRADELGCDLLNEPFLAIHLFDASSSNIHTFHQNLSGNILDITLIEFNGSYEEQNYTLEDDDIFITTDSKVEFRFNNVPSEYNSIDGYLDGYSDGYSDGYLDGYVEPLKYDIDEICFTSDKLRYLLDTGLSESAGRLSIFKDGKGFLNFRVIDSPSSKNGSPSIYNIATDVKNFKPGELHHISASWRLNTLYEKDEMHLFVDGLEAPNLYRFGGPAKVKINDKFSDVSKEVLQDFLTENIYYSQLFTDGTVLAGDSRFISESAGFTKDMVGRSIIFVGSNMTQAYSGKEYIINSVNGNEVTFVSGNNLDIVTFDVSASDISFRFPPTAGITSNINTDLKNSRFSVYRTTCNGEEAEMGGVVYRVDAGDIAILSGRDVINPLYRVNADTRVIEFVGANNDCKYIDSVEFSDLNVHIKTFGLKFELFNEKINLSSSSYFGLDNVQNDPYSGKSVLLNHAAEPVSLGDVDIKRVVLDRTIPMVSIEEFDYGYWANFDIELEKDTATHKLSSEPGRIHKDNLGRYIVIAYDSDNTVFCATKQQDDGYVDGYVVIADEREASFIRVFGETMDGSNEEVFEVTKNGKIYGTKLFRTVDRIEGSVRVVDPELEPFVIEVSEKDPVSVSNNGGESAEIFRYVSGSLILTTAGTSGTIPFELHPGDYRVRYPAHLKVSLPEVGSNLYIGCDINEKGQFKGIIDEFKVITEMSSDTRSTQRITQGTRSVTRDYNNPNPACPDDQTLILAHFDDPLEAQARKLRQREFLSEEDNFKYRLDREDLESLLSVINDKAAFESMMIRMGYDKELAERVFIEAHHAQGGPLFNEAKLNRSDDMQISSTSVNATFGVSSRFFDTPPLLISNRLSYFRKDSGSIELWVSPLINTLMDSEDRYFVDIYSVTKKRVKSLAPNHIKLPSAAKTILKVELLQDSSEFSEFMTETNSDKVFMDEVYRSRTTGRLTGGTGVGKDFSVGSRLSPDGKTLILQDGLPGAQVDVVVSYVPVDSTGDRISIYKNKQSQLVFSIQTKDGKNKVIKDIDWERNTWHRVMCIYRANSSNDYMRMFVDGVDTEALSYGDEGLIYGGGAIYGQDPEGVGAESSLKLSIKDDFRVISIGADTFGDNSALSRIDNIRFSRVARDMPQLATGEHIDSSYSSNIDTAVPVREDDLTTLLVDFDNSNEEDTYATVVDPAGGIFNFDVEVLDYFGKINDEVIEDLIVQLIDRLKPAHTNAVVNFPRETC